MNIVYKVAALIIFVIIAIRNANLIVIGTVDQINRVLKSINPDYPRQNLENLEKNSCFYTIGGVGIEIILKK